MVNIIWMLLTIIGIVFAIINGKIGDVNKAIFQGAGEAVTISIGLISVLVFWLGMMNIAQSAGLLDKLAKLFGLGNAATPLGIKAMEQLKKLNGDRDEASRSMITLLALNTTSLTLIPTTVIAIRITYNSANPTEIVGTTLLATVVATIGAIIIDRFFYYRRTRKGGKRK